MVYEPEAATRVTSAEDILVDFEYFRPQFSRKCSATFVTSLSKLDWNLPHAIPVRDICCLVDLRTARPIRKQNIVSRLSFLAIFVPLSECLLRNSVSYPSVPTLGQWYDMAVVWRLELEANLQGIIIGLAVEDQAVLL